MKDKIQKVLDDYAEIEKQFLDPAILSDMERMKALGQKRSKIEETAEMGKRYFELEKIIEENQELLQDDDDEMKELAKEEIQEAKQELARLEKILKEDLTPKDPNDPKNIILEVRAGAGGDEAAIFAGNLMRMYFRYAEKMEFDIEIMTKKK